MRVAVADDSLIVRSGVVALLADAGHMVCVEARDGEELLAALAIVSVEVVLLDVRMPPTLTDEGLQVAAELRRRFPRVGILLLSAYTEVGYATALLRVGRFGVGYLLKDKIDQIGDLTESINRVAAGECVIDPDVVTRLLGRDAAATAIEDLSPRERDVLRLMAEGRSNAGIGRLLHLQDTTVEKHVASVFGTLRLAREPDSNRRVAAVLLWLQALGRTGARQPPPAGAR